MEGCVSLNVRVCHNPFKEYKILCNCCKLAVLAEQVPVFEPSKLKKNKLTRSCCCFLFFFLNLKHLF